ncbi:hypothetical protein ZYGR_0H05330 [Zygosaccharomyces rouxii]|uniref:Ca3427-like PBP 2 domain-containing protein n=1 Tax=Zygosaccharomyces rouxii TaxID=4956 RepID=A0A1Q2ZW42_ZYGRO|nr:hypothetical protein ZYGR_0H05330 [Zygosaccharomyces rouxii]
MMKAIKLGFIPEHYSTPIHFAQTQKFFAKRGLNVELRPYPSGSGHLIQSLDKGELDAAVGLTEAFVRGIVTSPAKYSIVGTYVESPLHWAVSTGAQRNELQNLKQLEGKRIGVSRIGSGSYVMSFVLALEQGFNPEKPFIDFPVCHNFEQLRKSVNDKTSEAFMWEYFTTKKYYQGENPELKMLGSIYTPWPSWVLVRQENLDEQTSRQIAESLDEGISYFEQHPERSIEHIKTLGYSEEDAREWLKKVQFSQSCSTSLSKEVNENVIRVLRTAGVIGDGR